MSFLFFSHAGCAQSASSGAETGAQAADFKLTDTKGQTVALGDFLGKEAVLLVFSTTWCPHCNDKIPDLIRLHNGYDGKGLKVLAVYIQESREKIEALISSKHIPYTILLDLTGTVARQYGVRGVPALFAIDKKGVIREEGYAIPGEALLKELMRE